MKKKIAIFINSMTAGGAERVASLLLEYLKNDFDIYLVLLNNNIEYHLPEGQKIFCLQQPIKENNVLKILKLPFLAYRYKKFCRKNNIETSFSFLKRANYINCLSKMLGSKSKIIVSERTYLTAYLKSLDNTGNYLGRFLTMHLYPKADYVISNSVMTQMDLQENYKIRTECIVINNPVNLQTSEELGRVQVQEELFNTFTFIHVGGLRSEKNHSVLIDAFFKIKDLPVKLLLLGKGEYEISLRQKIKDLDVESKIIFLGFDNNPYKYLYRANCFILSSDYEGFPNSIQEALASGLPVISTDCKAGPREILAPNTDARKTIKNEIEIAEYGILVPVNNATLLASAMELIYRNNDLLNSYKNKARTRAKDFNTDVIIKQFKEILS